MISAPQAKECKRECEPIVPLGKSNACLLEPKDIQSNVKAAHQLKRLLESVVKIVKVYNTSSSAATQQSKSPAILVTSPSREI